MTLRPSVRINADIPLLRAGLERMARSACVDVAGDESADVTLRSSDQPPAATPVDVTVTESSVVIVCRQVPDPDTWEALNRLVRSALCG